MKYNNSIVKASDIIFTAVLVLAAVFVWALFSGGEAGNTVVFRKDGEVLASMPLDKDAEYVIDGEYTNEFTIENGSVYVSHTNCPNHQCEKMGAVSSAGAGIVCAPNRVSAVIEGEGAEIDAVTG
jgi:hypothetical protein